MPTPTATISLCHLCEGHQAAEILCGRLSGQSGAAAESSATSLLLSSPSVHTWLLPVYYFRAIVTRLGNNTAQDFTVLLTLPNFAQISQFCPNIAHNFD